jgi:hypothetical protein
MTVCSFNARIQFTESPPDEENARTLLRNVFLLLWHFHHTLRLSCDVPTGDAFPGLVMAMIVADRPLAAFPAAVHFIFDKTKKHEIEFLRLAAVFHHLSLAPSFTVANWSELLRAPELVRTFQVTLTARKQVFSTQIQLIHPPAQFLDFARPPFNIAIDNHAHQLGICMSTGKLVSMERIGSSYQALANYMKAEPMLSVTSMLMLTGPFASAFYLVVRQANTICTIPPIYLDSHGDEDVGFVRGKLLFLSAERLSKYEAMLLSGEWTDFDSPA